MRGDRPYNGSAPSTATEFTPHARGSTRYRFLHDFPDMVYPACAGIDLDGTILHYCPDCLPRMRGDRPLATLEEGTA